MFFVKDYLKLFFISCTCAFIFEIQGQEYPFVLPENITASLNVNSSSKQLFNNKIIGYNIQGFNTQLQKDFIELVDPVTIRFPHGVWANFYKWQTDGYQDDAYDNRDHEEALQTYACCVQGHIEGIASLNTQKKNRTGQQGYDMMWTYSINFDDGESSVARAQKDIGLGLEVKAIELGNEHFWRGQRSLRTQTPEMYLAAAMDVSASLKAEFPDIELSLPLSWRKSHEDYNNTIKGDGSFFDAITIHKYIGADPDVVADSNAAYTTLLTAKLEMEQDVNWVQTFAPGKPVWLTEWGVSAGDNVHAGACLGMADVYLYMIENQDVYHRANWFIFNRVLNSMVVVGDNREPIYPLQRRGYLSTYEIIQDVFRDSHVMSGEVMASAQLEVSRGSVKAVNARAAINAYGETKVVVVNLSDKPVAFELKFDNLVYANSFTHEALVFENLGVVPSMDYFSNPLQLIKKGKGDITLPPLSISKISGIYFDDSIQLISGTIEAEDVKSGGQDVGYFDTTQDNTFNAEADLEGVDVGSENGRTFVGDTQSGEWLKYNVNVLESNDYDFEFIYAAESQGTSLSIEMDDVVLFDNFVLPKTTSSSDFQGASKLTIPLEKGLQELKLTVISGGFVLDKINITAAPTLDIPIFVSPKESDVITPGEAIQVEATTSSLTEHISSMNLYLNDALVRSISVPPFSWGYHGQGDNILQNTAVGTYVLKLILTDNRGRAKENSITVTSTNFPTRPFSGSPHVVPGIIQMEDYDLGAAGVAFFDTTPGNSGNAYRTAPENDVDIAQRGTGYALVGSSGGEYLRYTINVSESGRYEMLVNYSTYSSTSKPFEAYLLPKDLSSSTLLFSAPNGSTSSGIRKITQGGVYQDYTSLVFDLESGVWVLELKIPSGGAGPSYDYVTLNRIGSLSLDKLETTNNLYVYPVPSLDGIFHLSKLTNWEVYSMAGVRLGGGFGNLVDVSLFPKGIYVLKTEWGDAKRLLIR